MRRDSVIFYFENNGIDNAVIWSNKKLIIEGSAHIRYDEKWLGEAFLNLLKNACEHTNEDGVIRVQLERTEAAFFCVSKMTEGVLLPMNYSSCSSGSTGQSIRARTVPALASPL